MRMYDVIAKKRDGGTLNHDELAFAVNGYVAGDVPDYQMSALLMAIYLRGMTDEETAMLTDVMAHSGDMVDLVRHRGHQGRQALHRRRRRQDDAGHCAHRRSLRREDCQDERPRPRPHRRHDR